MSLSFSSPLQNSDYFIASCLQFVRSFVCDMINMKNDMDS